MSPLPEIPDIMDLIKIPDVDPSKYIDSTLPVLLSIYSQVRTLNNNFDELIRLHKLPLWGRSIESTREDAFTGTVNSLAASSEEIIKRIPGEKKTVIGNISIAITTDIVGNASLIGFKEFINGDYIDHGTIFSNYNNGRTSPRLGPYVPYYDDILGTYILFYSVQGALEERISHSDYELIIYNNDTSSHDVLYAFNVRHLDVPELRKNKGLI